VKKERRTGVAEVTEQGLVDCRAAEKGHGDFVDLDGAVLVPEGVCGCACDVGHLPFWLWFLASIRGNCLSV
jgi:hypothetical protein